MKCCEHGFSVMPVCSVFRMPDAASAAECLRGGGVLIFPTETFYAIGCLAADTRAVSLIYRAKRRPAKRPLPILAADARQADTVAQLSAAPAKLFSRFWPGPLTVLLPARASLAAPLVNDAGKIAIRVTSHPLAAELSRRSGGVLTASSANMHNGRPVCSPDKLDRELLASLRALQVPCGILEGGSTPAGGLPSTLVEPVSDRDTATRPYLRIARAGAVSAEALAATGFACRADT
ncbi:L-threonylcarbamoyladenylate synthase [Candidatus Desulfovibrio trichonymphae]|nr:L-threonylcarbamoyladenylate synthase [Candidatus Desulfovibrio trichonymphae]GHU95681.1 threonylcarbamoyl-AMP synthase [Deltaproteobacteria bacterium]